MRYIIFAFTFSSILFLEGNSGGGLSKYWELYFNKKDHPRIQGGFIWDWVDQGTCIAPVIVWAR